MRCLIQLESIKTLITTSIYKELSSSFKTSSSRAIAFIILLGLGSITLFIRTLPGKVKSIFSNKEISTGEKEIENICLRKECDIKDVVKLSEKQFNELLSDNNLSSIIKRCLQQEVVMGSDGNVFFAGEKGLAIYSKALNSIGKGGENNLHGRSFAGIVYINPKSRLFEIMKTSRGYVAPGLENGALLVGFPELAFTLYEMAENIFDDGQVAVLDKEQFKHFSQKVEQDESAISKKEKTQKCYQLIDEIESKIYIACEEKTISKYGLTKLSYT